MIALFCGALPATALAAEWSIPDVDSLPMDAYGKTVRAGRDLIVHTAETIGPDAAAPAMRYSGNGLECQSCHLNAGTTKFALPLAGVWGVFPVFIGRENEVRTLEERIDGCMERSMNGHALPIGGPQMKAMLAYIKFISTGVPTGQSIAGRSTPPLPLPLVASDPRHGAQVFAATCAVCHQADGHGQRWPAADAAAQGHRYQFPPLWGPDSFNDGAGMARPIAAANFIHANMPFGTNYTHPVLSVQDAFDVAVFIDSQPRPHYAGTEKDFPDHALKPVDATYPPFIGPFPPSQHLTGPWPPIQQWMKANANSLHNAVAAPHD
ncbi:MAG TPA: c-type cytochrome [Acetobacteraceae bacterium]|jgi:thiosulfate dehydrogenase